MKAKVNVYELMVVVIFVAVLFLTALQIWG